MARPRNLGVNKSQAIRDALTANPSIGSKELIAQLAAKGVKVAPSLVYMVKSKMKQEARKSKRERAVTTVEVTNQNPVEVILRVKDLARDLGGVRTLKQLVDLLAE